jgi:hypothetical protein
MLGNVETIARLTYGGREGQRRENVQGETYASQLLTKSKVVKRGAMLNPDRLNTQFE